MRSSSPLRRWSALLGGVNTGPPCHRGAARSAGYGVCRRGGTEPGERPPSPWDCKGTQPDSLLHQQPRQTLRDINRTWWENQPSTGRCNISCNVGWCYIHYWTQTEFSMGWTTGQHGRKETHACVKSICACQRLVQHSTTSIFICPQRDTQRLQKTVTMNVEQSKVKLLLALNQTNVFVAGYFITVTNHCQAGTRRAQSKWNQNYYSQGNRKQFLFGFVCTHIFQAMAHLLPSQGTVRIEMC